MITNIIDKPRPEGHPDLLGVDKYIKALVNFIRNCQMPTTIGIQGEWGSGKTSMLNQIRYQLCESDNLTFEENKQRPFYGIWINTWQYSLMKTREETLTSILTGLTEEIVGIIKKKHENKTKEVINQVTGIFGKLVKTTVKATANAAGLDGGELLDAFQSSDSKATLLTFKKSLTDAIVKCLEEDRKQGNNNRGFIFFIDDLDRIDPPVAVEILELLKNIFEVDNCIFILAIDYEVVVKGLQPKFGPLTEKNEREFRSFFDKIIQLPFSMPTGSYDISNFLIESLKSINYITGNEENIDDFIDMVRKSVGTNPRSLKRLINTISLLKIINEEEASTLNEKNEPYELVVNFGLVCIQIAYPKIYEFLVSEPNFVGWNSETSKKYNLPEINEIDYSQISENELFSEEWEKILYRFCSKDIFLKSKVFDISELLNKLENIIVENKKDIETEIEPEKIEELKRLGLVEIKEGRLSFTERGEELARDLIRRHRLWEIFLHEVLGIEDVDKVAGVFEHESAGNIGDALCQFLDHPQQCPDGKPIPRGNCCRRRIRMGRMHGPFRHMGVVRLCDVPKGKKARVIFMRERLFARLAGYGIVPGAVICVEETFYGFLIRIDNTEVALDKESCADIFVQVIQDE